MAKFDSGGGSASDDDTSTDTTSGSDDPDTGQQDGSPRTRSSAGSEPQRRPPRRSDPMDRTADGNEPTGSTGDGGDGGASSGGGSGGSGSSSGGSRSGTRSDAGASDAPTSDSAGGGPEMQSPDGRTRPAADSTTSSRTDPARTSTTERTAEPGGGTGSTSGSGGTSPAADPIATSPSGETAQPRSDPMDPNTGRSEPPGAQTKASSDVNVEDTSETSSTTASTQSGSGLEDYEPGVDPGVRDQAERLEDKFIEQTPGVDDESQVRVVWDDQDEGVIRTELTESGQKAYVEEQVKQETGLPEESFNVVRTEEGSFEIEYLKSEDPPAKNPSADSAGVRDMGAKDDIVAPLSRPDAGRSDTRQSTGSAGEMVMARRDDSGFKSAEDDADITVKASSEGEADRALEGLGFEESGKNEYRAPNAPDNATLAEEEAARSAENKAKVAAAISEQTGQEYTKEDITVTRTEDGQLKYEFEEKESFDFDWSFGYGGPEDEVENTVDSAAESYNEAVASGVGAAADKGLLKSPGVDFALRAAGRDEAAESYNRKVENVGRGFLTGAAQLGNIPGLAGGVMEGTEVFVAGARETVRGDSSEFKRKAETRGSAIGEQVKESVRQNPAQTGGIVAGSLVASYGIISTASKVSSRAGAASRYAIQPGEEIAGQVGYRATRAAASKKAADRAFPNKEPLIFSEEAAIRAGKAGAQKVRSARSSSASGAGAGGASRVAREAKALQFRVAERFRSDAPTRGTRDGFTSRAADRARQEAVSARFRAAEASQKAREKASRARQRATEFASDERGQAQVPRSRARSQQESSFESEEVTSPELEDGSETSFSRSRARDSPMSDVEEPSISRSRVTGSELEAESELAGVTRSRVRRVETNMENPAQQARSRLRAAQEARVEARTDEIGAEMETTSPIESRARTESRADTRPRTELRTELETETETRASVETKTELETRTELETELEIETELESRKEAERWDIRTERRGEEDPLGLLEAQGTVLERDLINPITGE